MKIQDLFERDIHRAINGVVKADQLDASSVWQELDEFVVTSELTVHMGDLIEVLLSTLSKDVDASDKNGVWISGFFGCGKSHFIKVLSYLLENQPHSDVSGTQRRYAVEFFEDKFLDAMLYADLKKVVAASADTILFNIDSKADHRSGRDALLQVFLKVLNEKQGYSGDHPHIAHMERYLDEQGKLDTFHAAYARTRGETWLSERDAWQFQQDEVVTALQEALGQSRASVEKWVAAAETNFSLTVESFAGWVKRYLDGRGPQHRLLFLVDEVGQFIANDTHLMLNLQTITEQLGTICGGRAWVVVTSQEDLGAVIGDLKSERKYDFSKIQARFKTQLSLSSANVDEVIKRRLLHKSAAAAAPLTAAYAGKHDILGNQLAFSEAGMTFKTFAGEADFSACYPFAAYQFRLMQKVFESIRKAGATGLHLAHGERSTLDAFQSAAKQVSDENIGALVPFYRFYPAVEGFLDTAVKRTILLAAENHALEAFDTKILQVLFLIRYVEELPGSVNNLATLCVDQIDADKLALKKRIEAALARLESETLIARNGELYFFLTNEERDISREIKATTIHSGAEERELGKLLFEEILADQRRHTYSLTKRDFSYARLCDEHAIGQQVEGGLEVAFASPLGDSYGDFADDGRCVLHSSTHVGRVLIRLPDDPRLGRELRTYLQTETYVKTKHTGTLPETTQRILRDRSEDNRGRRKRIVHIVDAMVGEAAYFASGKKLSIRRSNAKEALAEALEYLIENVYAKMGYIAHLHPKPKVEIQSLLRANDIEQTSLTLATAEANTAASDDLREYLRLSALKAQKVVLHGLIHDKYGKRPYGWPELEVVLLVARLAVLREIELIDSNTKAPLPLDRAYDHLVSSSKQRRVILKQREVAPDQLIKNAQKLGQQLFAQHGPAAEEGLFGFIKDRLGVWHQDLTQFEPLAKTGNYPGLAEISDGLAELRKFVAEDDSLKLLKRFVANKNALLDLCDDMVDLQGFYTHQKHSWEQLRAAVTALGQNRLQLEAHPEAGPALARMEAILAMARPYDSLREVAGLRHTAERVNTTLLNDARETALEEIAGIAEGVKADLDTYEADASLRTRALTELSKLQTLVTSAASIAHIAQSRQEAEAAFDRALTLIEAAFAPPPSAALETTAPQPTAPESTAPESTAPQPTVATEPTSAQSATAGTPATPATPATSATSATTATATAPTPKPKVKRRRVVKPKAMWSGGFIETQADIDAFLSELRTELEAAIQANERVQIQ